MAITHGATPTLPTGETATTVGRLIAAAIGECYGLTEGGSRLAAGAHARRITGGPEILEGIQIVLVSYTTGLFSLSPSHAHKVIFAEGPGVRSTRGSRYVTNSFALPPTKFGACLVSEHS